MIRSSPFVDQKDAKATFTGSESFDPLHWGIKVSRRHFWSHDLVELSLWSPQFGDQNGREGQRCGIRMFWSPALGIKVSRKPHLIPWSCGAKSLILKIRGSKWTRRPPLRDWIVWILRIRRSKCRAGHFWSHDLVGLMLWSPKFGEQQKMRRPQLRDQIVLIPSIGGSKCRAGHFWSHERVDLMVWSPPFVDQTEAKAKLTWTGSTRAYITYTDSRQCDIFKALPLGFARRKKRHWQIFFVELIWKPISLNCEIIPHPEMYILLLRNTDLNSVGTRLETNGWATMRTQYKCLSG